MELGKNLILAVNGVPVAASKSCQFSIKQSFIDVCSPIEARVFHKKPTTYDWDMSTDCLIAEPSYASDLVAMVQSGESVDIQFYDETLGLNRYGIAYISGCDITGSIGSLSKLSISLVGSGALSETGGDKYCYIGQAASLSSDADVEALSNSYNRNTLIGLTVPPIDFGTSGYQYVWFCIPNKKAYDLTVMSQGFGVTLQDSAGSIVGKYRVWRTLNKINNIFTFAFS